jgi:hypothetical protein
MSRCVIAIGPSHARERRCGSKAQAICYKSGLNVLSALGIAGGPIYPANRRSVETRRHGETATHDYPILVMVPILRLISAKFLTILLVGCCLLRRPNGF